MVICYCMKVNNNNNNNNLFSKVYINTNKYYIYGQINVILENIFLNV